MSKLTDNDKSWGPFTVGPWKTTFSITLRSGGNEDFPEEKANALRLIGFGWVLRIWLPNIIPPLRIKRVAHWDEATMKRLGRNWYHEVYERVYGVCLSNMGNGYDFLQLYYGAQTNNSDRSQQWCCHLPWKQWTHVRHSLYTPDGAHYHTEDKNQKWSKFFDAKEKCPSVSFGFEDYDGELIVATCIVEEREWHRGSGWCRWLKYFSKPKIRRSLDLIFSVEVGPQKGSWKGGTIGHGIDMLPGENPEQAFRRYCNMEHDRKGRKFNLRFIGP